MKKECKVILIVTTILYIILAVLKVLKGFDISELSDITKFSSIYISISSIILLVYVWDRGDSEIAKIGLCCYLIGFIVDILQIAFFKQKLTPSTFDKTLDFIDSATSIGGSFMAMIALFGLIPSKSSTGSKIYVVAVISYLIHGAITLITIVNKFEYTSIIYDIDLLGSGKFILNGKTLKWNDSVDHKGNNFKFLYNQQHLWELHNLCQDLKLHHLLLVQLLHHQHRLRNNVNIHQIHSNRELFFSFFLN